VMLNELEVPQGQWHLVEAIAVSLMRLEGLDKHKARECAVIALAIINQQSIVLNQQVRVG
jgi:hypothetical protein